MKFSMTFEGGTELAAALDGLSARLSKKLLTEALLEGGEPIRVSAARHAPRGDPQAPNLADAIGIGPVRSDDMAAVKIGPTRDVFYGMFQELGTAHLGARPFLRPAFEAEAEKALRIVSQVLWRELAARGISRSASVSGGPVTGGPGGGRL